MKRFFFVLCVMVLCMVMVVPAAMAKAKKIRFSHVVSVNTPKGWAANEFANRVNKALEGRYKVVVFPNAQLYGDNQAIEALSAGFIEMAAPSSAKFIGSIPALQLFDMPFLFPRIQTVHKTVDGSIGDEIRAMFKERGLGIKLMTFWDNAFKQFSSNVRPLLKPADFKGVKFRIMSSDVLEAQMAGLGGVGLKLPFAEVYNALEQGVVDGQENTASNIYTKKFHEVQKYLTFSNHGYLGYAVIMNQKFWDKLPPDVQATINKIMMEVTALERQKAIELDKEQGALIRDYAKKGGKLQIFDLTPEQTAELQKAMKPVHDKFSDTVPPRWVEAVKAMK
ncbi:MAG: DctP family TRAP transporter solute-binding subunit [Desulfobacterales bacterium]|nr:MAG: DctP family TRAP transporter solute-binding subunit [Desulfobacterales bacterium]UCD89978.1 MAG: DctP family TRAP transporter solute-binding subunit [Desulfobacterales bacterium]